MVGTMCAVAYGQNCEDFSLVARASRDTAEVGKPFPVEVTLSNHSHASVSIYFPLMPTSRSYYEKSGSGWQRVWSAGIGRGTGSSGTESNQRRFPPEEYVKVAPGELKTKELDLSSEIWGPVGRRSPTHRTNRIRVVFTYSAEARTDEAQLNMLPCRLRTIPVEIRLVTKGSKEKPSSMAVEAVGTDKY